MRRLRPLLVCALLLCLSAPAIAQSGSSILNLNDGGAVQPTDAFIIARDPTHNFKILGSQIGGGGSTTIGNNMVLGNISGMQAPAVGLTQAQITGLLNSFSSVASGAVPASGGGTTNFLRADGTWSPPPGCSSAGSAGQVQVNDGSGCLTGITNTALTALLNPFSSSLLGAVPASGGGTANFLRADGSWALPPGSGPGGSSGQVQTNNGSGGFTGLTSAALTALLNVFGTSLAGVVPASGGGTSNFLRADGTWASPPGGGGGAPSGPAGGDLGSNYPNPTVVSLAHVTTGYTDANYGTTPGTQNGPVYIDHAGGLSAPTSISGKIVQKYEMGNSLYGTTQGIMIDPRAFGAQCNVTVLAGTGTHPGHLTVTASSNVVGASGYTFTSADIGKVISMNAVSGTTEDLGVNTGTITAVDTGANTATVSVTPTESSANVRAIFGTDDTSAFVSAGNQTRFTGGFVMVPDGCGVREWTPTANTTFRGFSDSVGYADAVTDDVKPTLWIYSTGFTEDSTAYGVHLSTSNPQAAFDGFVISGITFPFALAPFGVNAMLSCVGNDGGTSPNADGFRMTNMTLKECFVGFGQALTHPATHYNAGQYYHNIYLNNWIGENGTFNDITQVDDVWSANYGSGIICTGSDCDLRIIGGRIEESPSPSFTYDAFATQYGGFVCNDCKGANFMGLEWQFQGTASVVLNGNWGDIQIIGGSMEGSGYKFATAANNAHILLNGSSAVARSLHITGTRFGKENAITFSNYTQYILSGLTAGANNDIIEINGGQVCFDGYTTALANWAAGAPPHFKVVTSDCPQTIQGNSDYSFVSGQMGLGVTAPRAGMTIDALSNTTTANSSIGLPTGTSASRPTSPLAGMVRFNSDSTQFEGYYGGQWNSLLANTTTSLVNIQPGAGISSTMVAGGTAPVTKNGALYADASYYPGFKGGLTLTNDVTTPNTVIDVTAGSAVDDSNTFMMKISAFTKTTSSWALGTGNGCLDAGSVGSSKWYHVFVIERPDTGVTDILCSQSSLAPVFPANYTVKRDIGAFQTDGSSHIVAFKQIGNDFYRTSGRALQFTTSVLGTSAVLETLPDVPPGVNVKPICDYAVASNGAAVLLSSPYESDEAPSATYPFTTAPGASALVNTTTAGVINADCPYLTTNSQQQIRARASGAGTTLSVVLRGYTYSFAPSGFTASFMNNAIPNGITFARASSANYYNAAGLLASVTTNAARFDYDPVTHAAKGMLIEEAKTNTANPSMSSGWTGTNVTFCAGTTTSPDGTSDACLMVDNSSTSSHGGNVTASTSFASGTAYTASIYMKAGTATSAQILMGNNTAFSSTPFANFDLSGGTVGSSGNGAIAAIQNVGNGWYRCSISKTATGTASSAGIFVFLNNSNSAASPTPSYAGSTTGVYTFGAQAEATGFPTSFTATSRAADIVTVPSPPWFNSVGGSFTVVGALEGANTIHPAYTVSFSDGTVNNAVQSFVNTSGAAQAGDVISGVAANSAASAGSPTVGTAFTQTVTYLAGTNSASFNGTADGAGSFGAAGIPGGINLLNIGDREDQSRTLNGWVQSFGYAQ